MMADMAGLFGRLAALQFEVADIEKHGDVLPSQVWVFETMATLRELAAVLEVQAVEMYQAWIEAGGVPA